jgi:hypothetical protein
VMMEHFCNEETKFYVSEIDFKVLIRQTLTCVPDFKFQLKKKKNIYLSTVGSHSSQWS